LDIGDDNSVEVLSVVATADESVDAALAATSEDDESDSVKFVELVVFIIDESGFFVGDKFVV
jgi:hypothetical protein